MQTLHSPQTRAGILILALGVGILFAIAPFAIGLLGAAVLYVISVGLYKRLRRVMRPHPAAWLVLLVMVVVIVLPLVLVVGMVVDQAPAAIRAAQSNSFFERLQTLQIGPYAVGAELARAGGTVARWVSGQALGFVGGAAQATINLFIAFFGLFYLLVSGKQSWEAARDYIPFSAEGSDRLRDRFFSVTQATLLGTALTALLQGTLIGVGFALVGLPSPVFWGVITAIASVLPVLGSALVWLPGLIVLLVQGRYGGAITLGIVGGVVASNIDNFIRPLVYRRVSDIHPMITLVGAFAGVRLFGLLGVLLGPLAIAYFFELLQLYREEYGVGAGEAAR